MAWFNLIVLLVVIACVADIESQKSSGGSTADTASGGQAGSGEAALKGEANKWAPGSQSSQPSSSQSSAQRPSSTPSSSQQRPSSSSSTSKPSSSSSSSEKKTTASKKKTTTKKGSKGKTTKKTAKQDSGSSQKSSGGGGALDKDWGKVDPAMKEKWDKIKNSQCKIVEGKYILVDPVYCAKNVPVVKCGSGQYCSAQLPLSPDTKTVCNPWPDSCNNPQPFGAGGATTVSPTAAAAAQPSQQPVVSAAAVNSGAMIPSQGDNRCQNNPAFGPIPPGRPGCSDQHSLCSFWAGQHAQCNANPNYMSVCCKNSCGKC